MTNAELLAAMLARGATIRRGLSAPEILAHAEITPAGVYYVVLPALDQSHEHHLEADRIEQSGELYLELYRGAEMVALLAPADQTPEVSTDDVQEALQEFRTRRDQASWEEFIRTGAAQY